MSLLNKTIVDAARGLSEGAFSSVDLTQAYLTQARGLNTALNAYPTATALTSMSLAVA
jgi:Asp-tRNA(Asn)/Glu-tRNA(Gln) amidotransferase A subunit family amidase